MSVSESIKWQYEIWFELISIQKKFASFCAASTKSSSQYKYFAFQFIFFRYKKGRNILHYSFAWKVVLRKPKISSANQRTLLSSSIIIYLSTRKHFFFVFFNRKNWSQTTSQALQWILVTSETSGPFCQKTLIVTRSYWLKFTFTVRKNSFFVILVFRKVFLIFIELQIDMENDTLCTIRSICLSRSKSRNMFSLRRNFMNSQINSKELKLKCRKSNFEFSCDEENSFFYIFQRMSKGPNLAA